MTGLGPGFDPTLMVNHPMKGYVGTVDQGGSRRLLPEDVIPGDHLRRYVRGWLTGSVSAIWALLDNKDAQTIPADLGAGRHGDACGLLLNRAVEPLPLLSAWPDLGA